MPGVIHVDRRDDWIERLGRGGVIEVYPARMCAVWRSQYGTNRWIVMIVGSAHLFIHKPQ